MKNELLIGIAGKPYRRKTKQKQNKTKTKTKQNKTKQKQNKNKNKQLKINNSIDSIYILYYMDAFLQKPIPKDNDGFHITFLNKEASDDDNIPQGNTQQDSIAITEVDNSKQDESDSSEKTKRPNVLPFQVVDRSENKQIKREDFFNKDIDVPEEKQEKPKTIKVKKTKKKLKIVSNDKEKIKKEQKTPKINIDDKKVVEYDIEEFDRLKAQIPQTDSSIRIANQYYLNNKRVSYHL